MEASIHKDVWMLCPQVKEDEASAFIRSLQADTEASVPLGIDPALLLAAKRGKGNLSPAFLSACLATMDLPLRRCVAVAANNDFLQVLLGPFHCISTLSCILRSEAVG